jgi:MFS family permease
MFKSRSLRSTFSFMAGNILVFSVTDLLGNFARAMVFPYASLYILALGGDARQIGFVNSLAPFAGLIMFPIAGYIADQTSRIKLIVLGNYLSVAVVLMFVLAPSWELIALATLLRGFVVLQFPARSALIADSLSPRDRGRGIATMNTISTGLAIFAPYIAGTVIDSYGANMGVRTLYGVMMILYLASAIINLRFLKEIGLHSEEGLNISRLSSVLKDAYRGIPAMLRQLPPSLKALTGVIVLSFMANGVASPFWVVYAVEQIGLSPAAWGLILLLETVLRLLMFIPAGMLVDRWGRTASLLAALLLSLVAIPLFVFATSFTSVLLIRATVAIAFATAIPACTALMADTVPRGIRGRVMAAIGQGGIMIGPAGGGTGGPAMGFMIILPLMVASLAGGYLYAQNPAYPWFFVLITTAISIVLTFLFIRDPQKAEV